MGSDRRYSAAEKAPLPQSGKPVYNRPDSHTQGPPSACVWAQGGHGIATILYQSILDQAIRCRDPFVQVQGTWLVRRLSPYCSRIELAALPKKRDEGRLLYAMGWETANIHLGSRRAYNAVRRDLANRKAKWLREATKVMTKTIISEWKDWVNR